MKRRDHALNAPPERAPYFKVQVRGEVWTLRTPGLHRVGLLAKLLTPEQGREAMLLAMASGPSPNVVVIVQALQSVGAELVELLGAAIGSAWADPTYALETPQPADWARREHIRAYGAAVYEELYEAGWSFSQMLALALALFEQVSEAARFEREVQERLSFFLGPRATKSDDASPSSSAPSAPGEDSPSPS